MLDRNNLTRDHIEQLALRDPVLAHVLQCGRQHDLNWEEMMHLAIVLLLQQKTELAQALTQYISTKTDFLMKLTDDEIANLRDRLDNMNPSSSPMSIDQPSDAL